MKILSLFDGIACGLEAAKRAGIKVTKYVAYENDPECCYIAKKNHPEIEHKGSVIGANFGWYHNFDIIIGGSPCQGFSIAGDKLGFDDHRSKLYHEFVRAKHESGIENFLLENVPLDYHIEKKINYDLWTKPVIINSALVSAQTRTRFYWSNKKIEQPKDLGITLKSVFEYGEHLKEYKMNKTPSRDQMFYFGCPDITNRDKSNCLTTKQDRWGNAGLIKYEDYARYLTPVECERLQTLPDNYTAGSSKTNRYKMLGNCWTVNVIADIFKQTVDKRFFVA